MEIYMRDLKISIMELLENLLLRLEQLEDDLINNINVNERLVFLIDDLLVLSSGMDIININVDLEEYHFILNNIANNIENNEQYLLGEILTMELMPILAGWKGMIENE
jgi:hypothetical protein